ncbi:MAG TPA: DUF3592 domain-containing protein [Pyrinomonadaceae bacterium]|nr:DUF3592 domain-containing protein [Pyrinomonadaceae bacterium]
MDYSSLFIGGMPFLMGSAFFIVSILVMIRKKLRMKNWTKTTGLVTDVEVSHRMNQQMGTSNTLFRPKVRFQTTDGRIIDYQPRISNNFSNYGIGQQIEVYYNPQNPGKVMFGTSSWRLIVFAIFGGLMALFGIFFILISLAFRKF